MSLSPRKKVACISLTLLVAFYSLLRGCRLPHRWTSTHYLINYTEGFCKRGLVGFLGHALMGEQWFNYQTVCTVQIFFLACTLILLLGLVAKIIWEDKASPFFLLLTLAFFLSPSFVFLCHEVGYFEQIGFLLTFLTLLQWGNERPSPTHFALGLALLVVVGMIHEVNLIFCGSLFAVLLLMYGGSDKIRPLAALFLVCALTNLLLSRWGTLPEAKVHELQARLASGANFNLSSDTFKTLSRDLSQNMAMMKLYWRDPEKQANFVRCALAVIPTTLLGFSYLYLVLRSARRSERLVGAVLLLLSSPLLLCFVGFDINRWCALVFVMSYFVCCHATLYLPESKQVGMTRPLYLLILLSLVLGPIQDYSLFDRYTVKAFPFTEHLRSLGWLASGKLNP